MVFILESLFKVVDVYKHRQLPAHTYTIVKIKPVNGSCSHPYIYDHDVWSFLTSSDLHLTIKLSRWVDIYTIILEWDGEKKKTRLFSYLPNIKLVWTHCAFSPMAATYQGRDVWLSNYNKHTHIQYTPPYSKHTLSYKLSVGATSGIKPILGEGEWGGNCPLLLYT